MGKKKIDNIQKEETPVIEEIEADAPEIKVETVTVGTVNVDRLNVRSAASVNADIVGVITKGEKLYIDLAKSTDDFYAFGDGFVMKQFITV